ncbi:MAG: hypothetical protein HC836_25615 [Richelia sp. RM2_1_2]|nr:hypothetical protein [Richelia sp. RM2_1_2]
MGVINFPIDLSTKEYDLTGPNGNAFFIINNISSIIKQVGRAVGADPAQTNKYIKEYQEKAMSGDYDNVLAVSSEYVKINWLRK